MKRISWMGWLLAGFLLVQNTVPGLAAPTAANPLEGHLLKQSTGTLYLYHNGYKFAVQLADMSDEVIAAIPTASPDQWAGWFTDTHSIAPAGTPPQAPPSAYPAS
jgi:hypothetical protein